MSDIRRNAFAVALSRLAIAETGLRRRFRLALLNDAGRFDRHFKRLMRRGMLGDYPDPLRVQRNGAIYEELIGDVVAWLKAHPETVVEIFLILLGLL